MEEKIGSKKNVLFVMVDQVIAKTLGSYGGSCQTPNIDNLSKEGITFDNAYTPTSLCSPARASIFTGKLPIKHGIIANTGEPYGKSESEIENVKSVITHYLLNAGYKCGYAGKWHIGEKKGPREYGFEGTKISHYGWPGFVEEYDEFLKKQDHVGLNAIQVKNLIAEESLPEKSYGLFSETMQRLVKIGVLYSATIDLPTNLTEPGFVAEKTIELLKKYKDKPFFITASFWGPHHPAFPSPEFTGRHNPEDIPEWGNFHDDLSNKPRIQKRYIKSFHRKLGSFVFRVNIFLGLITHNADEFSA
ncbi:MAG: sulfatase-like hydrolase/transferase [Candidatus Firestonebacteria bacterium]